jgi:thioredoxin reductase (NADPH)
LYDTIVVGGGLAGLTAGLFAARGGLSALVLVSGIPGGQLSTIEQVEDFPGFPSGVAGFELGPTLQEQAATAGAEFQMAEAQSLDPIPGGWRVTTSDGALEGQTIIVATGSRPRELGVPGEERLRGRGISHCASCDGPLLRGKSVVVVGAGDSGLQEALTLAQFAAQVLVIERAEQSTAQTVYQQRIQELPVIELRAHSLVDEILGEQTVSGARVGNVNTGAVEQLEAAAVFVYIGLAPNTELLQNVVQLDETGRVPTDHWMRSERPGLFAAGDIRWESAGQAITAAGDGATAAIAARRYLSGVPWSAQG